MMVTTAKGEAADMNNITKKALAASASKLLEQKPLDKITIKNITDECGFTRNTFYYHFQDIYDLCSWIFIEKAEEILNSHKEEESWKNGFRDGINYLYENKRMIYHVYSSVSKSELERYLRRVVKAYALELVAVQAEGICTDERVRKITTEFYQNAFVGKILQWIDDDMNMEPELLADLCDSIFRGTVKEAIMSVEKTLNGR